MNTIRRRTSDDAHIIDGTACAADCSRLVKRPVAVLAEPSIDCRSVAQAHTGWMSACAVGDLLSALNVHDAVMHLVEGNCDLLIAYHHPSQPIQLDAARYEVVDLGQEVLAPYVKADESGQPLFTLPGSARASDALLTYTKYYPQGYEGYQIRDTKAAFENWGVMMATPAQTQLEACSTSPLPL